MDENHWELFLILPAISLDSPGSLTIKIRPLGADANSFSSLASKGSGAAVVVPLACVGVPPGKTNPVKIRQSSIYYTGSLGRWDKRLIEQASDVPSIIFFVIFWKNDE